MAKRVHEFSVGDIVKYRANFLRSAGWYTNVPRSGKVVEFVKMSVPFPVVEWCDGTVRPVNPGNLMLARVPG